MTVAFVEPSALPDAPDGSVVTVGTFDGVHRGHQAVLSELLAWAKRDGRRSVIVTFHPHPLRIVRPDNAPRLLTTPAEKRDILAESGLDYAVFLPFTKELAAYSPEQFVDEILIERMQMRRLVIGYDHGFGRGRSGDADALRRIGADRGFPVHVVGPVELEGGSVSSSGIRSLLEAGDVRAAAAALGRPYSLRGVVVRGDGRGRSLGFPTANLRIPESDKLLPQEGIYAVRAVLRGRMVDGVLHLGPRPTFTGAPPTVELHLFDFNEDLYGVELRLDFIERIRAIERYASVPELVRAIEQDCVRAKAILRT
jgi:riboflavin kinase/FMN adenylyltransferase